MKSRLILLAALATAVTGCKKEQPSAPASEKKDPLAAVPRTDSTLSLLEPQDGGCQWLRVDPLADKRAAVASFEGDCKGASIAWSSDLSKALVWFEPKRLQSSGSSSTNASPPAYPDEAPTPGATPRMYEVTVSSGEMRTVPLPAVQGELESIGYKGADLVALSLDALPMEQAGQESLTIDGQVITFDEDLDGLPALAYAYRLEQDGQWKRVEVKGTSHGAGLSLGINVLDAASEQAPRTCDMLESHLHDSSPEPTEAQLAKLRPLVPAPQREMAQAEGMPEEGSWARLVTPAGPVYVWEVLGDTAHTTGHLVLETAGQLQPVKDLGFTDGDLVSVNAQGPFLLVAAERVGTHPRLYDLRTGKLAFRSDTARAVTFWPTR